MCYISTETLDGETNLKPKFAPAELQGRLNEIGSDAKIEYSVPDKNIYKFDGQLILKQQSAVGLKNFAPRGSVLKHSDEVYALVLYTGKDTKQVLNQGSYKHKISQLQTLINKYMIISFVLIIGLMILMSQITNRVWHKDYVKGHENHFYLLTSP